MYYCLGRRNRGEGRKKEGRKREEEEGPVYGRMARSGHGLPKVSPKSAMLHPSTLCRQVTPETAIRLQGWLAPNAGGLQPFPTPSNAPCHTPMGLSLILIPPSVFWIAAKFLL
jgi:hypothetical protein